MMWRCEQRNIGFARANAHEPRVVSCARLQGRTRDICATLPFPSFSGFSSSLSPCNKSVLSLFFFCMKILINLQSSSVTKLQALQIFVCFHIRTTALGFLWLINVRCNIKYNVNVQKKNRLELHSVVSLFARDVTC